MDILKPLAPADETLIQYLKIGSDLVNRSKNSRLEMSSLPVVNNPLLDPSFSIDHITLRANHYINLAGFYKTIFGLDFEHDERNKTIFLGRNNQRLIHIKDGSSLAERERHHPGLFHYALKLDSEEALASTLVRLTYFHPELFRGATDDGVSVNFYFEDLEGNGMKIYADKRSNTWKWLGNTIQTNPQKIDQGEFLKWKFNEAIDRNWENHNISVGHVHLQVSNIAQARTFYKGLFNLNTTLELPTVNFLSANNYHQHISFNVWNSRNLQPHISQGLEEYQITLKDDKYFYDIKRKLNNSPYKHWDEKGSLKIVDPTSNVKIDVRLTN